VATNPVQVRRADTSQAAALTETMAAAFMTDPLANWCFPDPAERPRLHPAFFGAFVDLVLAGGQAYTTDGYRGVALWLDVDVNAPAEDDGELAAALERGLDAESLKRFAILDDVMTSHHPHDRDHAYLAFLAVHPDHQGTGIGTAMLRHRYAELDPAGRDAYLEASCERNARLYERLGFRHVGTPLHLPDGPPLFPMWRDATSPVA
jgi:ribosomal protein S18 acetylase RimI-like enzyme